MSPCFAWETSNFGLFHSFMRLPPLNQAKEAEGELGCWFHAVENKIISDDKVRYSDRHCWWAVLGKMPHFFNPSAQES